MSQLFEHRKDLQKLVSPLAISLGIDVALFDSRGELVVSTEAYLTKKGKSVHGPSIAEVLKKDHVVVNRPGHMESCLGCRFISNCPAKIELLTSIKLQKEPVGVISFTSFSSEGHKKITDNWELFSTLLDSTANLVSTIVYYKENQNLIQATDTFFHQAIDISDQPLLAVNESGTVNALNKPALEYFSYCTLYNRSIGSLLAEDLVQMILKGQRLHRWPTKINESDASITVLPSIVNESYKGSIIKIHTRPVDEAALADMLQIESELSNRLLGSSPHIQHLKTIMKKISGSTSTVLITGETGTGKGLLANAIHENSSRRNGPFISINCASIPETLFESELFGYEEGAFTGARKGGKPGKFELAHGGTIFLDEIGEMPVTLQSKLLKVLQERQIERVGGVSPIDVDVRVVAATNHDLEHQVQEGEFRSDLFFRLNVVPINLIPLNQRLEDIPEIAQAFLDRIAPQMNKRFEGIEPDVLKIFNTYDWPGNIRELENVIEYAANMEESDQLTTLFLPDRIRSGITRLPDPKLQNPLGEAEAHAIQRALDRYGWDADGKKAVADELGLSVRTLYRKIQKYGLPS